jgi:hypothetical protein
VVTSVALGLLKASIRSCISCEVLPAILDITRTLPMYVKHTRRMIRQDGLIVTDAQARFAGKYTPTNTHTDRPLPSKGITMFHPVLSP